MAVYGNMVITNQGLNLYAKVQAGAHLNFTRMQIGGGQLAAGQNPANLGALITPIGYFAVNSISSSGNTTYVRGIFENSSITASTYSCEIGLFATDPDLGEILYAYANAGTQGDTIPPISAGPLSKQYQINAATGNATGVTATIPANAYAPINSPAFTGTVTLAADPTQPLQAATKQYTDTTAQAKADATRKDAAKEFVVEVRTTDPSTPAVGRMWFRSDL